MLRNRTRGHHFRPLLGCRSISLRGTRNSGVQKYSAIPRGATIPGRFSEPILERMATGSAKFWDQTMFRNRARDDHFGSLFGDRSGAHRFRVRKIPGSKHAPRSHADQPFRLSCRRPFWSVSLQEPRISAIEHCCAIARGGPFRPASRTPF